jgi:hypothetical protein
MYVRIPGRGNQAVTLWIHPKTLVKHLLMLQPHRDTYLSNNACTIMSDYLTADDLYTFTLCYYDRAWLGTPTKAELQDLVEKRDELLPHLTPKEEIWAKI